MINPNIGKSAIVVIAALCAFAIPVQSMECTRSIGRSTVCCAKYSFPIDHYLVDVRYRNFVRFRPYSAIRLRIS